MEIAVCSSQISVTVADPDDGSRNAPSPRLSQRGVEEIEVHIHTPPVASVYVSDPILKVSSRMAFSPHAYVPASGGGALSAISAGEETRINVFVVVSGALPPSLL